MELGRKPGVLCAIDRKTPTELHTTEVPLLITSIVGSSTVERRALLPPLVAVLPAVTVISHFPLARSS